METEAEDGFGDIDRRMVRMTDPCLSLPTLLFLRTGTVELDPETQLSDLVLPAH